MCRAAAPSSGAMCETSGAKISEKNFSTNSYEAGCDYSSSVRVSIHVAQRGTGQANCSEG